MDNILELQNELAEHSEKLKLIEDILAKIKSEISYGEIGVGSKVRITEENGRIIEGRVWRVKKNGLYAINRDGYAAEILIHKDQLQNLSVGTHGELEKQQWLITEKIKDLKKDISKEVNKKISAIIISLNNGIQIEDSQRIIKTTEFESWYKKNNLENTIPLNKLKTYPEVFVCSLVREYVLRTRKKTTLHKLILDSLMK